MITATVNLVVVCIVFSQFRVNEHQLRINQEAFKFNQKQFEINEKESKRARSAQLIDTIYRRKDCPQRECPPEATARSRKEALLAYVKLYKDDKLIVDLEDADLSDLSLPEKVDLRNIVFINAKFQNTKLIGSDLRGAKFYNAVFGVCPDFEASSGFVHQAERGELKPRGADLRRSKLDGADFRNTSMCGVDIRGVDMSKVKNLVREQVAVAISDGNTKFPPLPPAKKQKPRNRRP